MNETPSVLSDRLCDLARRLRAGVDGDLANVRVDFVRDLPITAFAYGDHIAVSAQLLERDSATLLRVIAHELVHVSQQRTGRVQPNTAAGAVLGCDDATLEAQAEAAAETFVQGGRLAVASPTVASRSPAILQPLITVAGESRTTLDEFSPNFQSILALIVAGPDWLNWALSVNAPPISTDSEAQLLGLIQFTLHGATVALFQPAGLRVAPNVLMNLPNPDLGNVVSSLQTSQLTPAAQSALRNASIRTEADFGELDQVYGSLGVSGQLALLPTSLPDQAGLYQLLIENPPGAATPAVAQDAAAFAATVAQSGTDFGAAYSFYLAAIAQSADNPGRIPGLWTTLVPVTMGFLRCPVVPKAAPVATVLQTLAAFLTQWPLLGFRTIGTAVYNCGVNSGIDLSQPTLDPAKTAAAIGSYMVKAKNSLQTMISSNDPTVTPCQDGVARWFSFQNQGGTGRLLLDDDGCLTLLEFAP